MSYPANKDKYGSEEYAQQAMTEATNMAMY